MPTGRIASQKVGPQQKHRLTPADNASAMSGLLKYICNSSLESRWNIVYSSSSGQLSVTQGSPEIVGAGTAFLNYLGDVWVAFGASGFTPSKFYKVEAVHSNTAMRLEHFITEATAASQYFVIARPRRVTIEFEPGNYDFENFPATTLTGSACVSLVGISTDAQLMFDSSVALQSLIHSSAKSGDFAMKRLSIYTTLTNQSNFVAQQPIRLLGGSDCITNLLVERCYLQMPQTDFIVTQGAGTVIIRNNHGVVGYDGLAGLLAPDKVHITGNVVRSPFTIPSGHGKSLAGIICNSKAGVFGPRQVRVTNNLAEITDDGSVATSSIGLSCKISASAPTVSPNIVSQNNNYIINSGQTGTESRTAGFAAGIYSWIDEATPAATAVPTIKSHGDVTDLGGAGTHNYGYKAHGCRISIWHRPDAHPVQRTSNGTIYENGVLMP